MTRRADIDHLDAALRHCGSCRFHDVAGLYERYSDWAAGMGNLGFCRKGLPVVVPWGSRPDDDDSRVHIADELWHCGWPITDETEWCGEWQEDHRSYLERFGIEPEDGQHARIPTA